MKEKFSAQILTLSLVCLACNACLHPPKAWPASVPRPPAPPDTLFVKGLYLENFQSWLPWGITNDSLYSMYKDKGMHKAYYDKSGHYWLSIASITIFNDIAVDSIELYARYPKSRVFYLNIFIKPGDADKVKNYLKGYLENNWMKLIGWSESSNGFFRCKINGCDIGIWPYGKRGPQMIIENKTKSVNQWQRPVKE